jgi:uroporphyrinogen-III decarboxylase
MLLGGQEAKTEEMRQRFQRTPALGQEREGLDRVLAEHKARVRAARGDLRLVEALVREHGEDYFVYTGASAPFWLLYDLLGFEGMMMALHDAPKVVFAIMDESLEATLAYAQGFKDAGGHGVRVEECLASADMISPDMYERFVLPYEERLFSQLCRMGLKTILYFCGDVMPRLPALCQLPIDALMVEESKKNFTIDIGQVRAAVGPDLCLLGNVDSYAVVQRGKAAELAAEVGRQVRVAGADGAFILGLGSPLPLDTPPERVDILIRCTRGYRPDGREGA